MFAINKIPKNLQKDVVLLIRVNLSIPFSTKITFTQCLRVIKYFETRGKTVAVYLCLHATCRWKVIPRLDRNARFINDRNISETRIITCYQGRTKTLFLKMVSTVELQRNSYFHEYLSHWRIVVWFRSEKRSVETFPIGFSSTNCRSFDRSLTFGNAK